MHIAVVASPVTPLQPAQFGGAQSLLSDLAAGLVRRGHRVRLHCVEGSDVPGVELVTVPVPHDAERALVIPGGRPSQRAPGVSAAIRAMLQGAAEGDADVVSQHAFDAEAFRPQLEVPILHTLHLPPLVPDVVEAARALAPSQLATVSMACSALWLKAGVEIGQLLPNGVTDIDLEPAPVRHRALIAGRISAEKGVDLALAAAKRTGLDVAIAGAKHDAGYHVDLDGAHLLGPVTRTELRRLMAESAVVVCAPRWEEPFGMVAAEAQMAGCPVAAFARGGLPEVIEHGVAGWLAEPDDLEALADAIRSCLELDRSEVRASARRRLGIEAAIDRYEAALREVAS
jgi:glycosyltransferase involved in cell wall biosynthesis